LHLFLLVMRDTIKRFGLSDRLSFQLLRCAFLCCILIILFSSNGFAQIDRGGVNKNPAAVKNPKSETNNTQSDFSFDYGLISYTGTVKEDSIIANFDEIPFEEKYNSVKFKTGGFYETYQQIDTSMYAFHNYNPVNQEKYQYVNLGTLGSPLINLSPNFDRDNLDFNFGMHQFDPYETKLEDIEVFQLNAPYSYINWTFGPKNRQLFQLKHSNRIRDKVQLGLLFNKYTDFGYYYERQFRLNNQQEVSGTNHSDLSFYLGFNNKYKTYEGILLGNVNDFFYKQSGGTEVTDENVFEVFNTSIFNRATVGVNLNDAGSKETNLKFSYKHNYKFGRSRVLPVSDTSTILQFIPSSKIQHQFTFSNEMFAYADANTDTLYYPDTLFVGGFNTDSTRVLTFTNTIDFINTGNKLKVDSISVSNFKYNIGLKHQLVRVANLFEPDTTQLNNAYIKADLYATLLQKSNLSAHAQFGITGYEAGSYAIKLNAVHQINDKFKIALKASNKLYNTAYFNSRYTSNYFMWQEDFDKTQQSKLALSLEHDKLNLKLNATAIRLANFVYFTSIEDKVAKDVSIQRLSIQKDFKFSIFNWQNQLTLQSINKDILIDMPSFVYKSSFFVSNNVFRNNLNFQFGIDLFYNSAYFTPNYYPYTGLFYYTKTYRPIALPIIDVFFNFKIRTVNCFIKTEFANQGLFQKGYLTASGYPNQDVALRFGFSWKFFD